MSVVRLSLSSPSNLVLATVPETSSGKASILNIGSTLRTAASLCCLVLLLLVCALPVVRAVQMPGCAKGCCRGKKACGCHKAKIVEGDAVMASACPLGCGSAAALAAVAHALAPPSLAYLVQTVSDTALRASAAACVILFLAFALFERPPPRPRFA